MREFDCPRPVTVSVRIGGGAVEIIAEERTTATVDVSPYDDSEGAREAAANARIEMRGDVLVVEAPEWSGGWLFRRSPRLRMDIRVPLDSGLAMKMASADARCQGRFSIATINTASGDVSIEHVTGDLSVNTASGDAHAHRVDGNIRVNGASGDVSIGRAGGEVSVHSASGDVELQQAAGSVRGNTASGDIRIGTAGRGAVKLNSASGDVSIGVPVGTGVWLDLNTMSGSTRSDLSMSDAPPTGGAADLSVQVRTMSGDIDVHRVSVPTAA
jgi:hypothetical protein